MRTVISWVASKLPRRDITGRDGVYLSRFCIYGWMPRKSTRTPINVYLHRFLRPDEDRELHNHPWQWAISVILAGGYEEERYGTPTGRFLNIKKRKVLPFQINIIRANDFHRVSKLLEEDCWSLFITVRKSQSWGFKDDEGRYTPWREFITAKGMEPGF